MDWLPVIYDITEFLDRGGVVLYIIFFLAFVLWFLVVERLFYFLFSAHRQRRQLTEVWERNVHSDNARTIRVSLQYAFKDKLLMTFPMIQTLVRVTPLLGLFGTVYGMIEIFDVIAQQGTSDARAMASGISLATLPTMCGIAVGIVGLFLLRYIETIASRQINRFNQGLIHDETSSQN